MSTKILVKYKMIYVDSPVSNWHWEQSHLSADLSIAIFHIPFPFDSSFPQKIHQAQQEYRQVIVLCSELHRETVDFIKATQYPNVTYFTCGFISDAETHQWMDWFATSTDFYLRHLEILAQLDPYSEKPLMFDVLLGCSRLHRDVVYNYINDSKLADLSIMTYYRYAHKSLARNPNFINQSDVFIDNTVTHSVGAVQYLGESISLSKIVPIDIYKKTAYTVVTETNAENDFTFYTEKIVKPMLAKRLFVVLAGYNYLKNLKDLGFKTFDSIIDESYDNIKNNELRYKQACEQLSYLSTLPQRAILDKIKPIVEHNYQVLTETKWTDKMHSNLRQSIDATYTLHQSSNVQS